MWRVEVTGLDTGMVYVYKVEAPKSASRAIVESSAFLKHLNLRTSGVVSEGALPYCEAEWED